MRLNPLVCDTEFPPVTEAASWVANRTFDESFPLIDVSQAVPGYPTSPPILQHMTELLKDASTSKYGHVLGLPELRHAYAAELKSPYVSSKNVAITAGCNQAFYVAVAALCGPGDEVMLPTPWYFNHKMSLDMLGVKAQPLPGNAETQMIPNPAIAAQLINPNTKAIALVSPNNPTGQIYPAATIDAFYKLAKDAGVPLILDETYCDFRESPESAAHHIFDHEDWSDHAIHLYSFSKAYALAGYRVGALVASETFHREATKVLDCVAICAPQLSQHAALYGLQNEASWREEKRQLMYARASAFNTALQHSNHGYEIAAMGAYFAYLKHPFSGQSSTLVAKFLADEANILTLPGEMFGPAQENYLRVAFANVDQEIMPAIADRLAQHQL